MLRNQDVLRVVLASCFAGLTVTMATSQSASAKNSGAVTTYGRLQAKGNHIVGKDGKPVSLAGPSLFWSQWMGQYYTADVVKWVKKDWNATIIRAAVGITQDGYLGKPAEEKAKLFTVIDAAIAEDMYVIVDWHDHNAHRHEAQAIAFFEEVAKKYGDKPNIIYEIFNEPLGDASWPNVVKPYSERVIAAIRKIDKDNLILVGSPRWSQDVDVAAADPVKDPNVAYTLHFYAGTHKQWLRDKAEKAMNSGVALFVSEWGTCNANGDGEVDLASTKEWMEFMKKHHISHLNWSIADKVEGTAALKPGASSKGGWVAKDLTPSGQLVRELIRNWNSQPK